MTPSANSVADSLGHVGANLAAAAPPPREITYQAPPPAPPQAPVYQQNHPSVPPAQPAAPTPFDAPAAPAASAWVISAADKSRYGDSRTRPYFLTPHFLLLPYLHSLTTHSLAHSLTCPLFPASRY